MRGMVGEVQKETQLDQRSRGKGVQCGGLYFPQAGGSSISRCRPGTPKFTTAPSK